MAEVDILEPIALNLCAQEPIRIPGGIQPHGALLVVDSTLRMLQASVNLEAFTGLRFSPGESLGRENGEGLAGELHPWLDEDGTVFLRTLIIAGKPMQVAAHRARQGILLEFEAAPDSERETLEALYPRLKRFVDGLDTGLDVRGLAEIAVAELQALTGFNRVMLYAFDVQGDGTVLAEAGDGVLPSYLDLRFPASDIPAQARELYRLSRLRLIPDANYTRVPIEPSDSPVDGAPLDLSFAALRSVSPVHLEYMRNMETLASMSISILVDGKLWGLISLHNAQPKRLNAQVRTACDFLGQIVSLQIGARERAERAAQRIEIKRTETELLARLSLDSAFQDGLSRNAELWMRLVDAQGAAIVTEEHLITVGETPSHLELEQLTGWLHRNRVADVYATECLSADWPQAEAFAAGASGLLAISISQLHRSYIMWFRHEVVRTVKWGGDPRKPMEAGPDRLHPRQSFAMWKELVHLKSLPWSDVEIESARDFRNSIVNFVLRRAEERAELSEQLRRTNEELESFSYSISHDLRAPFRHIVGYAELLSDREKALDEKSRHYVESIVEAALSAGRLVDDLLKFSQLGRSSLTLRRVDMVKLVSEVRRSSEIDQGSRRVDWRIGGLPPAWGDAAMLRQALGNLIDNAVKYSQGRDVAVIEVEGEERESDVRYVVRDNGVGFDMAYVGKLFGVFQRLHRAEDFPGTGIGLALTKRIIDRHGGVITAEGLLNEGATFTFTLPKRTLEAQGV